ncbi:P-type DNA transfer ATPase VirB11 [Vibrio aerogenes]|uniref:P-type DNA transfer ATPase VirB11 n=1 Tax=Vibrio aerogenes TaxID=92172 RepID=UPI0021C27A78|nr:P-type DNA transfer ATPase VirB11 [Vibrio aerogenes]
MTQPNDYAFDDAATVNKLLETTGLQRILDLPGLTEVAVNQPGEVWYDRGNGWEREDMPNLTLKQCMELAKALATYARLPERLNAENPVASVILPNEERGQIAIPPVTKSDVVSMTFRKPSMTRFSLSDYEQTGRFGQVQSRDASTTGLSALQVQLLALKKSGRISEFFTMAVQNNLNILLVGGTGSGKTTVMKAMVDQFPAHKRIFTIEDVHELTLPNHPNHLNLFYKQGGMTPKRLIESCMRMKPDHVLLAELRGDEAWSYLEMLNTGHEGSITTIHANNCLSAPNRLADLVKQSEVGKTLDYAHIMRTIRTSIDVVAFFRRTHLTELYYDPQLKNSLLSLEDHG